MLSFLRSGSDLGEVFGKELDAKELFPGWGPKMCHLAAPTQHLSSQGLWCLVALRQRVGR